MLSKASKIFIIIPIFILLVYNCYSQARPTEQKYTILGISIEGSESADEGTILALSGLRVGSQLSYPYDENINMAIKNLWDRKQFSMVDISVDNVVGQGVFLTITVEENKRLNEIKLYNHKELSKDQITKVIGKNKGDIISNYDVYKIEKSIKELYETEGLAFARVFPELIQSDTSRTYVDLKIYIEEGIEFYVKSIVFNGNTYYDDSDLASEFDDTKTKSWWQFWRSAKFDKKEYKKDKELLTTFYKNHGFIDFEILSDSLQYDEDTGSLFISIDIKEGNKYYVRDIQFEGNTVFTSDDLVKRLDFEKGEPYNKEKFSMNLRGNPEFTDALSLYNNTGYLQTQFMENELRVADDSLDIIVKVYEGERYKIRKVDIVGNTKTKDKVIRRTLYTRPGDYFNRAAIVRSIKEMGVVGYFNPEKLRPDVRPVKGDNTSVDVVYQVEERSTDTFNASIGFAGSFGLTGSIGLTFNNFSITEPLAGGGGQMLNLNLEFGQGDRYRNFSLGFAEPWLFDEPTTIGFNIFNVFYNFSSLRQTRTGFRVNAGRRVKWPDDYFRIDGSLNVQWNDVGEQPGFRSQFFRPGQYSEISFMQSFSRNSLNEMFFPSEGSRFSWRNTWAMGAVGVGQTDFFKSELNLDFYNPLLTVDENDRLVLFMGTQIGYIDGLETDTTIAPIELYRMGGNGLNMFGTIPLRGYVDGTVENVGGKFHAKFTTELRLALTLNPMPIYFYGFAEAGNVWPDFKGVDFFELKRAAGVGIKMLLNPIGIIGFSYGYGFDRTQGVLEPSGWRFLFDLGQ